MLVNANPSVLLLFIVFSFVKFVILIHFSLYVALCSGQMSSCALPVQTLHDCLSVYLDHTLLALAGLCTVRVPVYRPVQWADE